MRTIHLRIARLQIRTSSRQDFVCSWFCIEWWKYGAQGRNRTTDTAIFSRMLYQLSYLGMLDARAKEKLKAHRAGGL